MPLCPPILSVHCYPSQNDLPLLSDYDKECLTSLASDTDVDFVALSYTRSGEDVRSARAFLDAIGMRETKILAKVATRQSLINIQDIVNQVRGTPHAFLAS